MISYLKGIVKQFDNHSITLILNNGDLGLNIFISSKYLTTLTLGQEIALYIYMNWSQDQGPSLYGFVNEIEKKIFALVISCSGIGPKIGLSLLSSMDPQEFIRAINEQDIKALSSINGIGAKKAEQIIVQLKHKIVPFIESGLIQDGQNYEHIKGITEVLSSLNYSRNEISRTTDYLKKNYSDFSFTFDQMLKQALSFLSKKV